MRVKLQYKNVQNESVISKLISNLFIMLRGDCYLPFCLFMIMLYDDNDDFLVISYRS